jgi:ABC-type transport system substrate-binding protein
MRIIGRLVAAAAGATLSLLLLIPLAAATPGVLRVAIFADPDSFDPPVGTSLPADAVVNSACDGLLAVNAQGRETGALAERWEFTPDGRAVTFHLRPGVRFHNGREFSAEDVRYSWERALKPELRAPAAAWLLPIVGAQEFRDGKAKEVAGLKLLDRHRVRVEFVRPNPLFVRHVQSARLAIVNREATEGGGGKITEKNLVCTGPFVLKGGRSNYQWVFDANPDYWGGKPGITRLELLVVPDENTRLAQYENGELDFIEPPVSQLDRIRKDPVLSRELVSKPRARSVVFGMNYVVQPLFRDRRVREALALAFDRKLISQVILQGTVEPGRSIIPPSLYTIDTSGATGPGHDPARAKKLLAEAGFPDGRGFPALELVTRPQAVFVKASEAVANQLQKNLGIPVQVRSVEFGKYVKDLNARNVTAFFLHAWTAEYLSPQYFFADLIHSQGPRNRFNYANPRVDALLDRADQTVNAEEQQRLYLEAEKLTIEDVAVLPFYYDTYTFLVKPSVRGLEFQPAGTGWLPLTRVTVER